MMKNDIFWQTRQWISCVSEKLFPQHHTRCDVWRTSVWHESNSKIPCFVPHCLLPSPISIWHEEKEHRAWKGCEMKNRREWDKQIWWEKRGESRQWSVTVIWCTKLMSRGPSFRSFLLDSTVLSLLPSTACQMLPQQNWPDLQVSCDTEICSLVNPSYPSSVVGWNENYCSSWMFHSFLLFPLHPLLSRENSCSILSFPHFLHATLVMVLFLLSFLICAQTVFPAAVNWFKRPQMRGTAKRKDVSFRWCASKEGNTCHWFLIPDAGSVMFISCCWVSKIPTLNCFCWFLTATFQMLEVWVISKIFNQIYLTRHSYTWSKMGERKNRNPLSLLLLSIQIDFLAAGNAKSFSCLYILSLHSIYIFCVAPLFTHIQLCHFLRAKSQSRKAREKKTSSRHSLFWFLVHMVPTPHCVHEKCVRRE